MKISSSFKRLLLIFIIFITFNVKADNIGYYLSNSELNYNYDSVPNEIKVKRGDYIYVTAVINDVQGNNYKLKDGRVTVRWDSSYLELVSTNNQYYSLDKSSFTNLVVTENSKTNSKITLDYSSDEEIKQGINKLMEFKFHVLDNSKTGSTKIYEMDGEASIKCLKEEETIECGTSYNTELKYNIESSIINTLSSIKIDGKQINNFSENINEYNIEFEGSKDSINIEAVKKDDRENITGDIGRRSLEYGLNTFNIEVTSESGDKKIYTINATRIDNRSKDNSLKELKLSDGIIQFKPDITDYVVEVRNEVNKITIIATLKDSKAKFKEDFSKKEIELIEGINKVTITVIAENEEEKIYTLNITRKLSGNNTLKELTINNELINLNKGEFLYYYTVSNEIENVSIRALPTDSNATVVVDNIDVLEVGVNEIGITVTAPNGDIVNYTVAVTREQVLSNDAKLRKLEVVGYKLNFNPDTTYYDLKIKDDDYLDLIYETDDEAATVTVEGNKNLVDGSIIKVNVKAEDNSVLRYFINIEKDGKGNGLIWIIIVPLIILLIVIIILLMVKKKKKKNKVSRVNSKPKEEVTADDVINKTETVENPVNNEDNDTDGEEKKEDVPMVDLEKTIFVKDLNPVIEEKDNSEESDTPKKTIDLE